MTKPTTPLRQRMIEDMAIRNMSPLTQAAYVRAVANFAIHHGVSPDKLTFEDVRKYQVHLIGRGLKVATIIPIMCALRFLYGTTLGLKDASEQIPLPRKEDTLPTVPEPRSSPARALHRSRWWHLPNRQSLDSVSAQLLPSGARSLTPVPTIVSVGTCAAACRRGAAILWRPCPPRR